MYKDRLPPESLYALKKRKGLVGSSPGTPAFSQAKGFNPTETAAVPISFRAPCIHNYQPQSKCSDLMPAVEGPTSQTAHDTVAKSKLRKQHSCFRFISCILRRGKKIRKESERKGTRKSMTSHFSWKKSGILLVFSRLAQKTAHSLFWADVSRTYPCEGSHKIVYINVGLFCIYVRPDLQQVLNTDVFGAFRQARFKNIQMVLTKHFKSFKSYYFLEPNYLTENITIIPACWRHLPACIHWTETKETPGSYLVVSAP